MKSFRSYLAWRPGAAALLTLDGSVIALLLAFFQINVVLQAFISQLKLEGFALMADMVYVTQVRVGLHCPDTLRSPVCCVCLVERRPILAREEKAELCLSWLVGCCVCGVDTLLCSS